MSEQKSQQTVTVSEDKYNGTATLNITAPTDTEIRKVKAVARKYFREKHGSRPSKVVAEHDSKRQPMDDSVMWTVMVADHSSGSLSENEQYDITTNND